MSEAELRALPDAELRRLQAELPPIISDASHPANKVRDAIIAECRRRGWWGGKA